MALIPCPECGRTVSDRAVRCPDCGHALAMADDATIVRPSSLSLSSRASRATSGADVSAAALWALSGLLIALVGGLLAAAAAVTRVRWAAGAGLVSGLAAIGIAARGAAIALGATPLAPRSAARAAARRAAVRTHAPMARWAGLLGLAASIAAIWVLL